MTKSVLIVIDAQESFRHRPYWAETGLAHYLAHYLVRQQALVDGCVARGVQRLLVSGIRTEQCCETTQRHASDSGFRVDFVSEATLTFPMRHARSGRVYVPDEIHERTELVLEGRFARIATVEQALDGLGAPDR